MSFDSRKKYKLIPEAEDLKVKTLPVALLLRPHLGSLLSETLSISTYEHHTDCLGGPGKKQRVKVILSCYRCLTDGYVYFIAKNRNLTGNAQKMALRCGVFSNPCVWELIKDDEKKLQGITSREFSRLIENPLASHYIEQHPEKFGSADYIYLFRSPHTINLVIQQHFSGEDMVRYGAGHEHFYPYFDLGFCRKILRDSQSIDRDIFIGLVHNVAAGSLIRNNLDAIVKNYPTSYGIIAAQKHLTDLVIENISLFDNHLARPFLNFNKDAVEFLEHHPKYIDWSFFVENENAMHMIEPYMLNNSVNEITIYNLNKNPAAISFLRRYPKYIRSSLLENANIFEAIEE